MDLEQFFLEEYKSLREEVYALVAETRRLEILSLGGVAAMYAWFVTAQVSSGPAWYAPLLLPLLGALRSYALFNRIGEIAAYLHGREKAMEWSGWETHFAARAKSRLSFTAFFFWFSCLP